MEEKNIFLRRRRAKQLAMALVFLFIFIGGWFWPLLGFFIPLCMLLGIGTAFFKGRKWCDWPCPRGSFYDSLIGPLSRKRRIPEFLKRMPWRITVLILLMAVMTVNLLLRWPSAPKIAAFFVLLLIATTFLGILLGLFIHQRTWCSFCPIGTVISLVSRSRSAKSTQQTSP